MRKKEKELLSYASLKEAVEVPHLLEGQVNSYKKFLVEGIAEIFKEVFPIKNAEESIVLEYVSHTIGVPKYSVSECKNRGLTYGVPLKVVFRLHIDNEIKEQEVYCGELPLMIDRGSFVVNGTERVIVSQLQRSPGVSYEGKMLLGGKRTILARIIPIRGPWCEMEYDDKGFLYTSIDRHRKVLVTTFLRAFFFEGKEDLLAAFYDQEKVSSAKLSDKHIGRILMEPIIDEETGEVIVDTLDVFHKGLLSILKEKKKSAVFLVENSDMMIVKTLQQDTNKTKEDVILEVFKHTRPGDPYHSQSATLFIKNMFLDSRRYDLSKVGRYRTNMSLGLDIDLNHRLLTKEDVVAVIKRLIEIRENSELPEDIDHLGRRRVVLVGEQVSEQFRMGLVRVERLVRERMMNQVQADETVVPHNFLNSRLIATTIKDFFQRDQLSQFMDQVNPLSSLTHKRRLSALGRRGLNRERAGFEVRDVHHSHYGRVCPIETPEGPNIGLIASMAIFSRVNEYGFLETPYRVVKDGVVTKKVIYLTANKENDYTIVHAGAKVDENSKFIDTHIVCRRRGDYVSVQADEINLMDVSTKQVFSLAAALIPFLEHNDANRALMGSNMQRQAVPLMQTEEPIVSTGVEQYVARDSKVAVFADSDGVVKYVDSTKLIFEGEMGEQVYHLSKYERSNSGTCLNQSPVVEVGEKVKKGQVLIDGQGTDNGRLALGRNVMVGFLPWRGYNFEDAIVVNERIVKEGIYTSLRVEEFTVEARDTKLGEEEITRDIPNVGESALANLDENGIIKVGTKVSAGDVLVGKVVPTAKSDLHMTGINAEERLLRVIFGEKNMADVRNVSLKMPSGLEGVVVGTRLFSKNSYDSRKSMGEAKKIAKKIEIEFDKLQEDLLKYTQEKLEELLVGESFKEDYLAEKTSEVLIEKGKKITISDVKKIHHGDHIRSATTLSPKKEQFFKRFLAVQKDKMEQVNCEKEIEVTKVLHGDELAPGIMKMVKVYVVCKRRLSVGDKMAGRHGNKGCVSVIVPEEDMPFLPDGRSLDILLNPLGVPSRMNVGQILEVHTGLAAKFLKRRVVTPVFDGATKDQIRDLLKEAREKNPDKKYLDESGTAYFVDGRTGKKIDQKVSYGVMYMLKLNHLVDDKKHARSTGPYSLVTQQPLGGKAQFGGQRFGEMEVWALEAYGAAYTLQEMLTVKSDDVSGRNKIYQAIVKNKNTLSYSVGGPESFNVLIKELQSLCLDVRFGKKTR